MVHSSTSCTRSMAWASASGGASGCFHSSRRQKGAGMCQGHMVRGDAKGERGSCQPLFNDQLSQKLTRAHSPPPPERTLIYSWGIHPHSPNISTRFLLPHWDQMSTWGLESLGVETKRCGRYIGGCQGQPWGKSVTQRDNTRSFLGWQNHSVPTCSGDHTILCVLKLIELYTKNIAIFCYISILLKYSVKSISWQDFSNTSHIFP